MVIISLLPREKLDISVKINRTTSLLQTQYCVQIEVLKMGGTCSTQTGCKIGQIDLRLRSSSLPTHELRHLVDELNLKIK